MFKSVGQSNAASLYPVASHVDLKALYVGQDLKNVEGPAAVIDVAVVRRNCQLMLDAAKSLGLGFRAHVKTHKTVELARFQVGETSTAVKLIGSTIAEAELLLPYMMECQKAGRNVNFIYGIAPSTTALKRLQPIREILGSESISFLIDHPSQLQNLVGDPNNSGAAVPILVKIDVGDHRAGVQPQTNELTTLLQVISHSEKASSSPNVRLVGFYSHSSRCYSGVTPTEALRFLAEEIDTISLAVQEASAIGFEDRKFLLSIGATPTATAIQLFSSESPASAEVNISMQRLQQVYELELHAGVYTLNDLQQIATHARPSKSPRAPTMTTDDIGFRVLTEVLSVYSERDVPEALIGTGTIALGREPCQSYSGWAIVAPSPWRDHEEAIYDEQSRTGWIVGRISQEHGTLTWQGDPKQVRPVMVGEKLLLWTNHACIAGANFGWYLIVDSDVSDGIVNSTRITDVWQRCRGW